MAIVEEGSVVVLYYAARVAQRSVRGIFQGGEVAPEGASNTTVEKESVAEARNTKPITMAIVRIPAAGGQDLSLDSGVTASERALIALCCREGSTLTERPRLLVAYHIPASS